MCKLANREEETMNMMERVTTQVQQQDIYFASQHSIQNLCEIVAQKDFALVSSRKIASLLSAIEPGAIETWLMAKPASTTATNAP
jgi:hypothetical protein